MAFKPGDLYKGVQQLIKFGLWDSFNKSPAVGIGENAMMIGTSIPAMANAGYSGLIYAGLPEDQRPKGYYDQEGRWQPSVVGNVPATTADLINRSVERNTYMPRSQAAQGQLEGIANAFDAVTQAPGARQVGDMWHGFSASHPLMATGVMTAANVFDRGMFRRGNTLKSALKNQFLDRDDKFWGIEASEFSGGHSFKRNGYNATQCTGFACEIRDQLGSDRVRVYGFDVEDNPAATAMANVSDGHDFAVVDGRYIVDPWVTNVESIGKGVYDLHDPADAAEIAALYGDPKKWKGVESTLEGLPKTVKYQGKDVEVRPYAPAQIAANAYRDRTGIGHDAPKAAAKVDPEEGKRIADAYEAMPHAPDDPAVIESYNALINETLDQWREIEKTGLKVEFMKPGQPDPYPDGPRGAIQDVHENNHLWVYPTDAGYGEVGANLNALTHPMLSPTDVVVDGKPLLANDVFRIVHDYFGHIKEGNGFRANGEETAWQQHASMYSETARGAMTSETRGQNSWLNWGPYGEKNRTALTQDTVFADQKAGLLPKEFWSDEALGLKPKATVTDLAETKAAKDAEHEARLAEIRQRAIENVRDMETKHQMQYLDPRDIHQVGDRFLTDNGVRIEILGYDRVSEEGDLYYKVRQTFPDGHTAEHRLTNDNLSWQTKMTGPKDWGDQSGRLQETGGGKKVLGTVGGRVAAVEMLSGDSVEIGGKTYRASNEGGHSALRENEALITIDRNLMEALMNESDELVGPGPNYQNQIGKRIDQFKDFYEKNDDITVGNFYFNTKRGLTAGNGRHRTRVMLESGMDRIPVTMPKADIVKMYSYALEKGLLDVPTRKGYKLFRVDEKNPGQLFPLFVNAADPVEIGKWLSASEGPITQKGKVKSKLGDLAYRPGWHAGDYPIATHIGEGGQPPVRRRADQVWGEVEFPEDVDWQTEATNRAQRNKKGEVVPRTAHITDTIPFGGNYRYKTNPNMTGEWLIGGNMRVNRLLSDAEVQSINQGGGVADLPRAQDFEFHRFGFFNPASDADINVGLDIRDQVDAVDPADIVDWLDARGVEIVNKGTRRSNTENTFTAKLSRPLSPQELYDMAKEFGQEAVVQRQGQFGKLYGPNAAAWGEYNPDYFQDPPGAGKDPFKNQRGHVQDTGAGKDLLKTVGSRAALGADYPELPPPELQFDKKKNKEYLAKGESPETKEFMKRRRQAQKEIDKGNYDPYFDPNERYDASGYDPAADTTQHARPKKPETVEKWRRTVQTDEGRQRLQAAYDAGVQSGGHDGWYKVGQLQKAFIDELGPEEGRKRFDEFFAQAMAATTGGADPKSNLIMAHYGNYRRVKGLNTDIPSYEMPHPIGGRYASGNMAMYQKVLGDGQAFTPEGQPKRHNFAANFRGDRNLVTVDEQMTNIITPGLNAPPGDSYFAYEELIREMAAKNGVDPREFQEVAWGGKKWTDTGGKYQGRSMIEHVNEAIERTSRLTGMTPDEVVKGMIHGNKMLGNARTDLLAWIAGGGLAGLGAYALYDEGQERTKKLKGKSRDLLERMEE